MSDSTGAINLMIHARFLQHYRSENSPGFTLELDTRWSSRGITILYGRSGSGKTTLLRCIAGLEKPDQGFLSVDGQVWQDGSRWVPPHKRPVGYVFQEPSLFPHLSVRGNLDFARKRSTRLLSAEEDARILAIMGIERFMNKRPGQLSGGERQRVAIARALLIQPRLLLMDEPLASLDTDRKQEILPFLERLRSDLKLPVLYVSHSMAEVTRLADYALILQDGKLVAQGSPEDVFSRVDLPITLGEESGVILTGVVAERDTRWHLMRVAFAGGDIWVSASGIQLAEPVRIRVLARDVSLALQNHEDSSILNRLPARVLEIVPDGNPAMALVRLQVGPDCLQARLTLRSVHQLHLTPGLEVWAQIKSAAVVC